MVCVSEKRSGSTVGIGEPLADYKLKVKRLLWKCIFHIFSIVMEPGTCDSYLSVNIKFTAAIATLQNPSYFDVRRVFLLHP